MSNKATKRWGGKLWKILEKMTKTTKKNYKNTGSKRQKICKMRLKRGKSDKTSTKGTKTLEGKNDKKCWKKKKNLQFFCKKQQNIKIGTTKVFLMIEGKTTQGLGLHGGEDSSLNNSTLCDLKLRKQQMNLFFWSKCSFLRSSACCFVSASAAQWWDVPPPKHRLSIKQHGRVRLLGTFLLMQFDRECLWKSFRV